MISFDEAVEFVRSIAKPLETETIAIANAAGRILARPVVAQIDSPRSDVSAMDGYAVREEDLKSFPALLQLVGGSFAGRGWAGSVAPGTCVRIFTGAPLPEGADRVIIQENVRSEGNEVVIDGHPGKMARHALRYSRRMKRSASGALVAFMAAASHSSFLPPLKL